MDKTKNVQWNKIRWAVLGCVSLFFFIRGIQLILTGVGWIATSDQHFHWILLYFEIIISSFTTGLCFYIFLKGSLTIKKPISKRLLSIKTITLLITTIFIIHIIRVGFWIQNSVLWIRNFMLLVIWFKRWKCNFLLVNWCSNPFPCIFIYQCE